MAAVQHKAPPQDVGDSVTVASCQARSLRRRLPPHNRAVPAPRTCSGCVVDLMLNFGEEIVMQMKTHIIQH